jgi:aquaporin Z
MIYALGSVSGAHLNPAVTLGVLLSGRNKIAPIDACAYMVSQLLGGICAGLLYLNVFGMAFKLAPVGPHYSTADMCAAEILYTWALVYVVLNVATASENDSNHYFGLAIGFTVVSAAISVGAISGCSLNPAVSVGSIVAAHFTHGMAAYHFSSFYIFAPFVGAIIGVLSFYLVRRRVEYGDAAYVPPKTREMPMPPPQPVETRKRDVEMPKPAPTPEPPALRKQMSRKLSSNELVKIADLGRNLENANLFCGLKWEVGSGSKGVDIDASCVKFDKEGRCLGAVYFADKEDHENGIRHSGDQVTGEMTTSPLDDEAISFRLSGIKPEINFLFFVATIFSSGVHSFQDVSSCSARLVDANNETELLKFEKSNIGSGNDYFAT